MRTQNSKLTFFKGKYLMSYDHNVRKRPKNQNFGKGPPPTIKKMSGLLPDPGGSQSKKTEYRVIKSSCNKQYLSDKPKNCKKCPNPMIFRKLLCGGFVILMSHNDQVEQLFHFTVLPKWWVGFSTAQSCMD